MHQILFQFPIFPGVTSGVALPPDSRGNGGKGKGREGEGKEGKGRGKGSLRHCRWEIDTPDQLVRVVLYFIINIVL